MTSDEYRDLKELIEGRFSDLDGRFETIDEQFKKVDRHLVEYEAALRAEIRTSGADTRVHFDVVAEKFREDVKRIADGHTHHTTILDDHEARLTGLEQARLRFEG